MTARTQEHKAATTTRKNGWSTIEQTFKKASKSPAFKRAYQAETERIRMARTLREARLAKKLTQAAVAKKVAMPQSVIARLESGNRGVSFDTLSKVAKALGKRVELV